jgi:hypothetical protein
MCDTVRPLNEFGRLRVSKDGMAFYCKSCMRGYNVERRRVNAASERSASSGLKTLARKAMAAERKVAKAKAAQRSVAAEYKAAAQSLAPALAALKAAVSALEALMGPTPAPKPAKARTANGTTSARHLPVVPSSSPPLIREIKAIVADDRVSLAEAKRIQEREIVARAEWRPSASPS